MKKNYANTLVLIIVISVLSLTTATIAQNNTLDYKVKGYFKIPANIKNDDYMAKTVVLKIKPQYSAVCSNNEIKIDKLKKYLLEIGSPKISRKFPHAQKPELEYNKTGLKYADLTRIYQFTYTSDLPLEKVINTIYSMNIVEYAEPNYIPKLHYTPNDPSFSSQYYLYKIKALQAWDIIKGDTNIVIGIVDSEIQWDHSDLITQIKYNDADPINGADDDNDGYIDNYRGYDLGEGDNDTKSANNIHGTHVSGCAAAATDNSNGVASPGFNCKILPVKIANSAGSLIAGYEGIEYAANHGVNIINCSWGSGGGGQAGQDVIDYATINKDVLILASAGNDADEVEGYPAAYNYVISVAATNNQDKKASFSSYGTWVDISAPGQGIYATYFDNIYSSLSGTSMSSPVAAGAAAIIKSAYPWMNALQVGEQLKVTCDNIDSKNTSYMGKLGNGRTNMFTAVSGVTSPSVVMTQKDITSVSADPCVPNDTIYIRGTFVNHLLATANMTATLTTTTPSYITIIDGTTDLGTISMSGSSNNNTDPFIAVVNPGVPINAKADFEITLSDGTYLKKEYLSITINVDYINITVNEVLTSITSKSLIGFNDFATQNEGLGFRYIPGDNQNLLFDGGLMVGVPGKVSDHVRKGTDGVDDDFTSVSRISKFANNVSDFDIGGTFSDSLAGTSALLVKVHHKAYAWNKPGHKRYVIVEYTIQNTGTTALNNMYAGIFTDWDINMGSAQGYDNNKSATDVARKIGYTYNLETGGFYAGVQVVSDNANFNHYAIDNDGSNGSVNIYTTYTTEQKYTTLSTMRMTGGDPTSLDPQGARDQSNVVSTGPFNLSPGDSVTVAFALLAGDNLTDLQNTADSAKAQYPGYMPTKPCEPLSTGNNIEVNKNQLLQNYPNPASESTVIAFTLAKPDNVCLSIYNLLGEEIYTASALNKTIQNKGTYQFTIDVSNLKSGIYFYRLKASDVTYTKKMIVTGK